MRRPHPMSSSPVPPSTPRGAKHGPVVQRTCLRRPHPMSSSPTPPHVLQSCPTLDTLRCQAWPSSAADLREKLWGSAGSLRRTADICLFYRPRVGDHLARPGRAEEEEEEVRAERAEPTLAGSVAVRKSQQFPLANCRLVKQSGCGEPPQHGNPLSLPPSLPPQLARRCCVSVRPGG